MTVERLNKNISELIANGDIDTILKAAEPIVFHHLHKTKFWDIFPNYRDDMLQEGRMAIWEATKKYNGKALFSTFAHTLVRNTLYNYVNKMKLFKEKNLTVPLTEALIESNERVEEDTFIIDYIYEDPNKEILIDYFVLRLSQEEVAKRNGLSQQRISQIVTEFRERVKEAYFEK
ncbi:MAG: sigma-70 family RNA polymerase sigma factor [Flavobacteriia bacterium]|nr:sigma-70 family RNA polymerase sigma factor [Flavobacteriia bacterium]